jgi:hypothetical protein
MYFIFTVHFLLLQTNTPGSEAESEGRYNFLSKTTVQIAAGHDQATWATRPLHRVID